MSPQADKPKPAVMQAGDHQPAKDYAKASAEEIMQDIERTRAHMDTTLDTLGRRLKPGPKGMAAAIGLGIAALGAIAWAVLRARHGRKTKSRRPWNWRQARVLEQAMLAARLAQAARKGKPAIIVVEPRKV